MVKTVGLRDKRGVMAMVVMVGGAVEHDGSELAVRGLGLELGGVFAGMRWCQGDGQLGGCMDGDDESKMGLTEGISGTAVSTRRNRSWGR